MFIFGHIGVTLGIFYLLYYLYSKKNFQAAVPYIIIGSLLPDIIDKPLGRIILAEVIGSGRIFAHTLLFAVLLGLVGYYLYQKGSPNFIIIAGASFCHLLEDEMWNNPKAFFWPFLGWEFPRDTFHGSFMEYLTIIINRVYDPALTHAFISEIIGLVVIALLIGKYIQSRLKENYTAQE